MAGLFFGGLIKGDFDSGLDVVRVITQGSYVDGIWQEQEIKSAPFRANVQPLSDRELNFLSNGGERIVDARKIYINDESFADLDLSGYFEFDGQRWKPIKIDKRKKRMYCKVIVSRVDE